MNGSRFTVVQKASFRPSKVVFYQRFYSNHSVDASRSSSLTNQEKKSALNDLYGKSRAVDCNKHNFEISFKASKRIKEKVSWLYELARNKTVTTSKGVVLQSFKMNFITLTLPSNQHHPTAEITKQCLGQFLTELKSRFNLLNYVWRLEFQANGNAHYHIATDTYIDYMHCKLIWNRCLEKLGYVTAYQQKMSKLNFEQYRQQYSNGGKIDFDTLRERFGRGTATRWNSPNTVDVRAVSNHKNIAFYISKYITKASEHKLNPIVSQREESETNLRLWYCSSSLSRLSAIEIFMEGASDLVIDILSSLTEVKKYVFDYCSVWFFNNVDQVNDCKRKLWKLFRRYATETGYIPA